MLIAKVKDEGLLMRQMHEFGTILYRAEEQRIVEVAYFSDSRTVHYEGTLSEAAAQFVRKHGEEVHTLSLDLASGMLRIAQ